MLRVCSLTMILRRSSLPKETGFCKADQCGGFQESQGLMPPSGATLGCLRQCEKVTPVGSLVESYCTMSSLPLPISFVPKLKKHQERREAHSTTHTTCCSSEGQRIRSHHILKVHPERKGRVITPLCSREGKWDMGGWGDLPGHEQHPAPQATGLGLCIPHSQA